jgi:hypothetical protein
MKELTGGGLELEIVLHNKDDVKEWIELSLSGLFAKSKHWQEVGPGTPRTYKREEAIVIGLRQLAVKAIKAGLIAVSVCPSDSTTSNITTAKRAPTTLSTELGS